MKIATIGFAIVAAGALIAVVAILAHRRSRPPPTAAAAVATPSVAAVPPRTVWPSATPALVVPAAPTDSSKTIEICGAGRVAIDPNDQFRGFENISKLTDARSAEWIKAMLNSDDTRARATGLMLQGKVGDGPLAGQVMTDEAREALVQLAVGAGDPAVYAMAVYACHTYGNPVPDDACSQVSLSTWAHMDTNNAVPWLLLAQQARVHGDEPAAANAFAQAAKAQKVDSYNPSFFAFADPEQPNGTTPLERWSFSLQVVGVAAALQPTYTTAALRYCTEEAMQDITVRQQCNAVATLFVDKSSTVLDLAIGTALGKKIGWPAERVNALTQEKFAMMEAQWEGGPVDNDQWSCSSVARGNAYWRRQVKLGELGAAREAMAQTGDTPEVLAKKLEERLSRFSANAAAIE